MLPSAAGMLLLLAGCTSAPELPTPEPSGATCGTESLRPAPARLLTRSEYRRTVNELLGSDVDSSASFPAEPVVDGFDNNAESHQTNPLLVEKYADSAMRLAADLEERGTETLFTCTEGVEGRDCAEAFITAFGARAYRRPLEDPELRSYLRLYDRAAPTLGHEDSLNTIVETMLQAPQFLYRIEAPIAQQEDEAVQLGPYEIASRLSYFLWGSMPDKELFSAAESGELETPDQVEAQARRLLADEKSRSRVREFHSQWLALQSLHSVAREGAPEGVAASWEESLLRFTDEVFWSEDSSVRELYTSSTLHVNAELASLYGIEHDAQSPNWSRITNAEERHGLLTHPSFMALHAHSTQSSPIQRGVFIREKILCERVEPPPPSVNNNPPDPDPTLTTRERFAVHTEQPACSRCHELIDPLGFGFENYDQLGRFRETENDLSVDSTGALVELSEEELNGPFENTQELAARIADSDTALDCLARKWVTFALGRPHMREDSCSLDAAVAAAQSDGGSLRELLVALCTTRAFRYRKSHESDTGSVN